MQKIKIFCAGLFIITFSLFFVATKQVAPCDGDCEKMNNFNLAIRNGRENFVMWAYRCSFKPVSDTICVMVRDTSGINWVLFADTACTIATQYGLSQQKIFILKNSNFPPDTLAKKQCP
jgi:hypothetical protein